MRATYVDVPEEVILQRRRMEIDLFDEMWEGELHMSPLPHFKHQGIVGDLLAFFKYHWQALGEGVVQTNVGVKRPGTPDVELAGEKVPSDYRGPDLLFLLSGHEDRVQEGWVVGPPDAVIEVRSPGDETYKKLPFYHSLGVPEVIVIHRNTKAVEVYVHGQAEYERKPLESDGSVASAQIDTVFRTVAGAGGGPVLHVQRGRFPERTGTA